MLLRSEHDCALRALPIENLAHGRFKPLTTVPGFVREIRPDAAGTDEGARRDEGHPGRYRPAILVFG